MILNVNAPRFVLSDQHGQQHTLEQYQGQYLVLYFYPKDDTPGCTTQACNFRDADAEIRALGANVLGVSADDAASHQAFAKKHQLNFPLLVDTNAETAKTYGAYGEKNMYGKIFVGLLRQTFLIDPNGQIIKHWKRVNVDTHAKDVADEIRKAQAGQA